MVNRECGPGEEVFVEMVWRRKAGQVTFERSGMEDAPDWVQEADRRFRGKPVGSETAAPQPPAEARRCTCPSGDGSLRWPCPVHPPSAPVGVEAKVLARDVHYAIRDAGLAPESPADDAAMRDAILAVIAQQPAAVDDATVERMAQAVATELYGDPPPPGSNSLTRAMQLPGIRRALAAALAGQQGGRDND